MPKKRITIMMLLLFPLWTYAGMTVTEQSSFHQVSAAVTQKSQQYGAEHILIVLDIDNTLLTSEVDLGGDVWYQWQTGKLKIKPTTAQKVPCLYQDAIGLLYKLGTMKPTEAQVPSLIQHWQQSGHGVIALTARAPNVRPATERALARRGIDFSSSAVGHDDKGAPVYRQRITLDHQTREMSYMKGIMMTTGLNKGEALKYLLKQTDAQFKAIVFVDDSEKNIMHVQNSFKGVKNIDLTAIHYTHIEQERIKAFGTVLTQQQANTMASQWDQLNQMLDSIFPGRINAGECLNP